MDTIKNALIFIAEWWGCLGIPFALKIGLPIIFVVCLLIFISRRAMLLLGFILVALLLAFFLIIGNFHDNFSSWLMHK